jgi:hypothetical protein
LIDRIEICVRRKHPKARELVIITDAVQEQGATEAPPVPEDFIETIEFTPAIVETRRALRAFLSRELEVHSGQMDGWCYAADWDNLLRSLGITDQDKKAIVDLDSAG